MAVVFGLGNPGPRYARTRHSIGFRVLGRLVERWEARAGEPAAEYRSWSVERGGRRVHLVAPQTFMNRTGEALEVWRRIHGLDPADLLVVADDVYLPLGMVRLRTGGSSGGHLGLESIERALPGRGYARLRVGVGRAESGAQLREHVLEEFDAAEDDAVTEAVEIAADAAECWVAEGAVTAMNRFNRRIPKEVDES